MATKREDVELGVSVNVTNAERIDSLSKDLKQLADQGVLTAEDFERLGNELKQLGAQGAAVDTLQKVETELKQTTDALTQATAKADALGSTLAEQTNKTKDFLEAQQQAAAALRKTKEDLIEQNRQLDLLNNEYDKAGKRTDEYKTKAKALKDAIVENEAALKRQSLAFKDASDALRQSNKDLAEAENASKKATKAADDLSKNAQEQSQALQKAAEAAQALGLDSASAANAQSTLARSINSVTKEAVDSYRAFSQDVSAKEKAAAVTKALAELEGMLATEAQIASAAAEYHARNLAEEAAAAERAAKATRDQTLALEQQAVALRQSVDAALGTVGVRSAQALRAEINQVKDAMGLLRQSGELTGKALEDAAKKAAVKVNELELELRQVTNQLTLADRAKLGFNSLADGANALIGRFGALGASVGAVVYALKPFFDTAIQFDSMRRSLTAVTGSAAEAEKQIAFLRETAKKSGIAIGDISDAFVRFTASARSSGLSTKVVQDVFSATALAAGNLGLSSDKLSHILDALAQMANKGVVSMEELRQQLGDSLPGALSLLAKGLGITEQQLVKLVESGQLLTADALPALAQALTTLAPKTGQVEGLAASFNNLKNAITQTTQAATEGGGFSALVAILKVLGGSVLAAYTGFLQLVEVFTLGIKTVFRLGEAITTFSTGPLKKLVDESSTARDRISNLGGVFSEYVRATTAGTTATTQAGNAMEQSGQQASTAAGGYNANAQAQGAAAGAATTNAGAQVAAGNAAAVAGQQAQNAVGQWYALQIQFKELNDRREKEILNAEQYAKAAKIEGDTRQQLAKLAGDEGIAVKVAADAHQLEADKLAVVSNLRQQEVDSLKSQRDQLVALAQQLGDPGGSRAKEIEKINQTIAARQAEAEKANQSAEAARLAALASDTAAKTYADNATKLNTLRSAYESTVTAIKTLEAAQKAGMATQGQVDAARERSAVAEALYRDAVKDSAAAVERKTKALESHNAIDRAAAELAKARIDSEIAIQTTLGNSSRVIDLNIEKRKIDLNVSKERIEVTKQEIALAKQQLEIDAAAIKQNDPLREQKTQDIELRREGIRVREFELQRQQEIAKQTERQIQLDQQRGATSLNASSQTVGGLEREIETREKANSLIQRAIDLENKRRGVDAKGFSTDTTGQTVNGLGDTYLSILNQLKGYGLNDSEATQLAREFTDSNGNVPYFNNPGQLKYGGPGGGTLSYAIQQAAAKYLFEKSTLAPAPSTAPTSKVSSAPSPAPGPSSGSYKVDINLGGSTTTINTASDADARNLVALMQNLQSRTAG